MCMMILSLARACSPCCGARYGQSPLALPRAGTAIVRLIVPTCCPGTERPAVARAALPGGTDVRSFASNKGRRRYAAAREGSGVREMGVTSQKTAVENLDA